MSEFIPREKIVGALEEQFDLINDRYEVLLLTDDKLKLNGLIAQMGLIAILLTKIKEM